MSKSIQEKDWWTLFKHMSESKLNQDTMSMLINMQQMQKDIGLFKSMELIM